MKYIFLLSILAIALFFSCNSHKKAKDDSEMKQKDAQVVPQQQSQSTSRPIKILEYSKGACHGRCPIYKMTFLSDGVVYYEGKQFSEKMGIHTLKISEKEINSIIDSCKIEDFSKLPEYFKSMIPDWASSTLVYYGDATPKTITWREESNPFLSSLSKVIEEIEKRNEWTLEENQSSPKNTVPNQIIVEMESRLQPDVIVTKYRKYGLKLVEKISADMNLFLMEYNGSKIPAYEMLNLLQRDESVSRAEFNIKVSPR